MLSRSVVIGQYVEFIYCACGCGKTRPRFDKYGKERLYLNGHSSKKTF